MRGREFSLTAFICNIPMGRRSKKTIVRVVFPVCFALLSWHAFQRSLDADFARLMELIRNQPGSRRWIFLDARGARFDEAREKRLFNNATLRETDPRFIQDVIAVEDGGFYEHAGVDWTATSRAFFNFLKIRASIIMRALFPGSSAAKPRPRGGSTITQQLVKNLLEIPPRTVPNKIREIALALRLERWLRDVKFRNATDPNAHAKDFILVYYLNRFHAAHRVYGLKNGAYIFLNKKSLRRLSSMERITLLSLINAPGVLGGEKEAARRRLLGLTLSRLAAVKRIDRSKPIGTFSLAPGWKKRRRQLTGRTARAPRTAYAASYLSLRGEAGGNGGRSILATHRDGALDHGLNRIFQREIRRKNGGRCPAPGDEKAITGAFILLRLRDGAVLSLGEDSCSPFNELIHSRRFPHSLLKPFLYALVLRDTELSPRSVVLDRRYKTHDRLGRPYAPGNHYVIFKGGLTLKEALAHSSNTVSLRIFRKISPYTLIGLSREIFSLRPRDGLRSRFHPDPSLALGTVELSPAEVASGYLSLLGGGTKRYPLWLRGKDRASRKIPRKIAIARRLLSPVAAYQTREMLTETMKRLGTAGRSLEGRRGLVLKELGGKSGSGKHDSWFAGFSEDLLLLVWLGMREAKSARMPEDFTATLLWGKMFETTTSAYPPRALRHPPYLKRRYYCARTGSLRTGGCRKLESALFPRRPGRSDPGHPDPGHPDGSR